MAYLIYPPLYMIGKKIHCWRCNAKMSVIALLTPKIENTEDQVCILTGITKIPNELLDYIQKKVPTFKFKYSKMANQKYYANTCPKCKIIYGDFFLTGEPGSPFFPMDETEAKSLYIKEIPFLGPVKIDGSISLGVGEMILDNAAKV